jgi:diacylglycerol kinase (ATP)
MRTVHQPPPGILGAKDVLLVNPLAGGGRGSAAVRVLREFADRRRWTVEIYVTANADDFARAARQAAERGRRIFSLGGDGTFQLLLNAVRAHPQSILGVIPAGGGNDFATALGLPRDPLQSAALLLEGEICEVDVLEARCSEGTERFYIGGGGVGLDAEAVRHANGAYRYLPGRTRYVLSAIRALSGFRPPWARVTLGGKESKTVEMPALLVGALNTSTYGGGLGLAPDAEIDDGNLDVVVLEDLGAVEILRLLPALAFRGKFETDRIHRFRVPQVRIETERPCSFHGDGELLGSTPVEIAVLPRAVRVVRPARKSRISGSPQ